MSSIDRTSSNNSSLFTGLSILFNIYNIKTLFLAKVSLSEVNFIFAPSFLLSNNNDLFNNVRPNNMGIDIGYVINSANGYTNIKLTKDLKLHDGIRIINNKEDYGTEIFELFINGNKVKFAK